MMGDMRDRLIQSLLQIYKKDNASLVFYFTEDEAEFVADQLIESGVMLPPCRVGDTVYFIPKYITDWIHDDVEYIKITKDSFIIKTVADWYFDEGDFGKTVFLTKDQAEQKLKEMIGDNAK